MIDENKLNQFLGQMLGDLGGASSIAMVRMGDALAGAQAGEANLSELITGAGFSRVRRASETPFNMILEARP